MDRFILIQENKQRKPQKNEICIINNILYKFNGECWKKIKRNNYLTMNFKD